MTLYSDECAAEVTELSVASGVLSRHTAMVAVDQDGKTQPKPQPLPETDEMCELRQA